MKNKLEPDPPRIGEHHVRVPDQLAHLLRADRVHERGVRGRGVRIAVIDSGFYPHPFYVSRGYKITRVATKAEPKPHVDEYGHGTAQLASIFALAPEAEVFAIKCMERFPFASLETAIALKPDVLVCAWGFNVDHPGTRRLTKVYRRIHELLLQALAQGIRVVAAAGNGQRAFPGSMPEVISVGGVYYGEDGKFSASDISSRFVSSIFRGRRVPDFCALSGNAPHGRLLLVPVPPRARLARRIAFSRIAAGTETQRLPGWSMFSGTSASTAMVGGAVALLLEENPTLTQNEVREVLAQTSRFVEGELLIDVDAAVTLSKSLCKK